MIRKYLHYLASRAEDGYIRFIPDLLEPNPTAKILDLGCYDGKFTSRLANRTRSKDVFGVELLHDKIGMAQKLGVKVVCADLDKGLPFADCQFDIVHANQVIEHMSDVDLFLDEIHRVLAPNGYALISTENLAAWHNIASLFFGWQPFSSSNMSIRSWTLGNPLALFPQASACTPMRHKVLFALQGFTEFFVAHDFKIEHVMCNVYYPAPPQWWPILSRIDPRHAVYQTIKARKKLK